jgi:hypothetical protein
MIASYLEDRTLVIGEKEHMDVTCGVPQGSVIGPTLWNVYYDGVLGIPAPKGVTLIAYADDLAVLIRAKGVELLKVVSNIAIRRITDWMQSRELKIAAHKTEAVLLVAGRKVKNMEVTVLDEVIQSVEATKYLGIFLDRNTTMTTHIQKIVEKANKQINNISRLMPKSKGPKENSRRILFSVVNSIVLYGASIWGRILEKKLYRNKLMSVQRRIAIRIIGAYRTTSTKALLVIARSPPVYLLVRLRAQVEREGNVEAQRAQENMINNWQEEWDRNDGKGEWTRRLIPVIERWMVREHGEVDFFLSQILTGHGCFMAYFKRFNISTTTDECPYCENTDTVEHTFFVCPRWNTQRELAEAKMGRLEPENLVEKMLQSRENWKEIRKMSAEILTIKRKDLDRSDIMQRG